MQKHSVLFGSALWEEQAPPLRSCDDANDAVFLSPFVRFFGGSNPRPTRFATKRTHIHNHVGTDVLGGPQRQTHIHRQWGRENCFPCGRSGTPVPTWINISRFLPTSPKRPVGRGLAPAVKTKRPKTGSWSPVLGTVRSVEKKWYTWYIKIFLKVFEGMGTFFKKFP